MEAYERLIKIVEEIKDDVDKAEGGNKAAGTRVRKAMQDVKQTAQDLRKQVLEVRDQPQSSNP
jgi:hypothetical protein